MSQKNLTFNMFQTAVTLFSFQTNPILLISVFLTMPPPFSQLLKLLFPFLLSISSHRGSTLSFSHPFQLFHPKLHSLVISFPTIGSHYFIRSMNHFQKRSNNIFSLVRNPPCFLLHSRHINSPRWHSRSSKIYLAFTYHVLLTDVDFILLPSSTP